VILLKLDLFLFFFFVKAIRNHVQPPSLLFFWLKSAPKKDVIQKEKQKQKQKQTEKKNETENKKEK